MRRSITKRLRTIYVAATFVFLLLQGYEATEYLARAPGVFESFGTLGYSGRVLQILGGAKLLGIVLLAVAPWVTLKQLIHLGFALGAVGALASHLSASDPLFSLLPLLALIAVQLVSYSTWRLWLRRRATRRRYHYFDETSADALET